MTDNTIVALFDDPTEAQQVLTELEGEGIATSGASAISRDPETGSLREGIVDMLRDRGVPADDAHVYAEGVRRGGTLISMTMDDDEVDHVVSVLERHEAVEIDQRGLEYRRSGWMGYDEAAEPYVPLGATNSDGTAAGSRDRPEGGETVIPITEEHLEIGKREISRGRVRVHSRVVETPVDESVTLRDETISVERRPVDPAHAPVGPDAFEEQTIEMIETDEEAVVAKTGRVTEEVVVRKDVEQQTETVSDMVRKTEVEVERDPPAVNERTQRRPAKDKI